MKDVLIIAQYTQAPGEFENDRFKYLSEMLIKKDSVEVEVVTMDFSHHRKEYRDISEEQLISWPYKMTFLHVTPYKKNVSIKRLYANHVMANNLKAYLSTRKKPDVLFCAVPSVAVASEAASYCRENGIRFVIDIQDLWPEAFLMAIDIPIVSNLIFSPMKRMADKVYKQADAICAVSETYIKRAVTVNAKSKDTYRVFLGTDLRNFDKNATEYSKKVGEGIRVGYCGTVGRSYDLHCVVDALKLLKAKTNKKVTFIVMGDGPDLDNIKSYAKTNDVSTVFLGRLPYKEMCGVLANCDIVVNPIIKGASQSIINKHADYAASGLPVINTQECNEYRTLVDQYNMGFNCENEDADDMMEKLLKLIENSELRVTLGKNARRCAEECFDRKKTYLALIEAILGEENV